jgi:hypothetical protein
VTIGTVQEFARSKKGAPQVKIDGKYYYVGKCNIDGMSVGDRIEFESNAFGDRGTLFGLQTWKMSGPVQPKSNGHAAPAPTFDGDMLRYASNVVANAIQAGLIKEPKHITPWFWAAMDCPKASDDEPPFNDEIP